MDPFSGLKNEVFRPLAAVVLPGVFAVTPFSIVVANEWPEIEAFYASNPSWFFIGLIAVGTIVGMLLEDIGTSLERGIDRCIDLEYLFGHDKVWLAYLSCGTTDNNGRRFLGTTVTRMKFINSMIPALVVFSVGIFLLHSQTTFLSQRGIFVFAVVVLVLLTWLFRTTTELSEVASLTRYCLLAKEDRPPEYDIGAIAVRRHRHLAYAVVELLTSRAADIDLRGRSVWVAAPQAFQLFFGLIRTKTNIPSGKPDDTE